MTEPRFLGVDVGTQGARALLVTASGEVIARGSAALAVPPPGPVQEQAPDAWWDAVVAAIGDLGAERGSASAIAISCTSGSVCAVDAAGRAVGPGLLYADTRAVIGAHCTSSASAASDFNVPSEANADCCSASDPLESFAAS